MTFINRACKDRRLKGLEHAQRKDETMMNNRTKTLWLPALASVARHNSIRL